MAMKKPAAVSGDTNSAVLTERMRVAAILESPEGKRNPAMATELALRTSLDVEQAKAILATAPVAHPFIEAMNLQGPIGLSAATADFTDDPKAARLQEIGASVKAFNEAKGYTTPKAEG